MPNSGDNLPYLFAETGDLKLHLVKIAYSAFYFALTFILLSYFDHVIAAINARILGYHPVFNYDVLKNLSPTSGWSPKRIAFVYLSGPLLGLIISWISAFGYNLAGVAHSHLKLFLYWLSLNGFVLFFSYLITGILSFSNYTSIFFTGFSLWFNWLFWDNTAITMLLIILSGVFGIFYPFFFWRQTLRNGYSGRLLEQQFGRVISFINTAVLPVLTGSLIILGATLPMNWQYQLIRLACVLITLLIILLWIAIFRFAPVKVRKGGIEYYSPVFLLIGIGVLLLLARLVLSWQISL